MLNRVRDNWFSLALIAAPVITVTEPTGLMAAAGTWLGNCGAPEAIVCMVFFLSGLELDVTRLKKGVSDLTAIATGLAGVFALAPLISYSASHLGLPPILIKGLSITAVVPTTLSTCVVMTRLCGGNSATALVTTIAASWLAVFTIPTTVHFLLGDVAGESIAFDKWALSAKIALLVLTPLVLGMGTGATFKKHLSRLKIRPSTANQFFVVTMIWIAVAGTGRVLLDEASNLVGAGILAFAYHGLLLTVVWCAARAAGLARGRLEAPLFCGAQKTLPMQVLLQQALFPQQGEVLLFCIVHHMVHLPFDGFVANVLKKKKN